MEDERWMRDGSEMAQRWINHLPNSPNEFTYSWRRSEETLVFDFSLSTPASPADQLCGYGHAIICPHINCDEVIHLAATPPYLPVLGGSFYSQFGTSSGFCLVDIYGSIKFGFCHKCIRSCYACPFLWP